MKLLIYVNPKTALANGSAESGPVNYVIDAELASNLGHLAELAGRFTTPNTPPPDVHRLTCAAATDDAVLDALMVLQNEVDMAKRWARRVLDLHKEGEPTSDRVPPYIIRLWDKFPHALYRDLLGGDVREALGLSGALV